MNQKYIQNFLWTPSRYLSTSAIRCSPPIASASTSTFDIFDRQVKKLQRNRAAANVESSRLVDYVRDGVAGNLAERLADIKRRYSTILEYGSGAGHLIRHLDPTLTKKVIMVDSAEKVLYRDEERHQVEDPEFEIERILVKDDEVVPFEENSHDAIVSCLSLHWINDLPGVLVQLKKSLKPDGVLMAAIFGGDTLFELRTALQLAELERDGGIAPRISPMTDSPSMAALLNRAGFSLPTVDVDEITISYPSMFELMEDLSLMGESNVVTGRKHTLSRDALISAAAIYKELHGLEDGTIPATFQIIYVIGWKPDVKQPKPLERGSAKQSLKDVL